MNHLASACRPLLLSCALAAALAAAPGRARAEGEGAYFEPDALARRGYELRLRLAYATASRTDFSAPVFLYAQPPRALDALELRTELDVRVALARMLALQAVVPFVYRSVETTLDAVSISPQQQLPPLIFSEDGFGVGDSTLALSLRFVQSARLAAFVDLGTRVALDDNPGSTVLPERIPAGTGQSALFAALGASLQLDEVSASLSYRLQYAPGDAAAYLVRRVGNQGYTSGVLAPSLAHFVRLQLGYAPTNLVQILLRPDWSYTEQPALVERRGTTPVPGERARHEIGVEVGLRFTLHAHHRLMLAQRYTLLESHRDDPFFPLAIPARGPSLTWQILGD